MLSSHWPSVIIMLNILIVGETVATRYEPNWTSLDSRPLPSWYDVDKLGIFAHWGIYAVPAFHSEWFWYYWRQPGQDARRYDEFVASHFHNGTTYAEFATQFTAEDFDADRFADIVKSSGAKYFVLTSKHHEGFTLWPSATAWNWNAVDVGAHMDLVDALARSVRGAGLRFGTYFSLMDWFHPLYMADKSENGTDFVETVALPQLRELVTRYRPDVIWSDGDWEMIDKYWRSEEFLAWLYNDSPIKDTVAVNDRWGSGTVGKHGGFLTYSDQFDPGVFMPRKWENCLKLDVQSWGYRRDVRANDVLPIKTLITTLARTIACGGNLLLNVGPDRTGRIAPIFEERLRQLGDFVHANEEAIFGTLPWIYQNESSRIWYTSRLRDEGKAAVGRVVNFQNRDNTVIYAFVVEIPSSGIVKLPSVITTGTTTVTLLGTTHCLRIEAGRRLAVDIGQIPWQEWPFRDVVVLKIEYAASDTYNPIPAALGRVTVASSRPGTASRSGSPHSRSTVVVKSEERLNETLVLEAKRIESVKSEKSITERNHLVMSNFK